MDPAAEIPTVILEKQTQKQESSSDVRAGRKGSKRWWEGCGRIKLACGWGSGGIGLLW